MLEGSEERKGEAYYNVGGKIDGLLLLLVQGLQVHGHG